MPLQKKSFEDFGSESPVYGTNRSGSEAFVIKYAFSTFITHKPKGWAVKWNPMILIIENKTAPKIGF